LDKIQRNNLVILDKIQRNNMLFLDKIQRKRAVTEPVEVPPLTANSKLQTTN